MKNIIRIVFFLLVISVLYADNKNIIMFCAQNDGKITPVSIEKVFERSGYHIEANHYMAQTFRELGKNEFKIYNSMIVYEPKIAKSMVLKYPKSGIFLPFTILFYQKKGNDKIYAGVLSAYAMAKIIGLSADNEELQALQKKNIKILQKALKKAHRVVFDYSARKLSKEPLTHFAIHIKDSEARENKSDIEMLFESEFEPVGFNMANFMNYDFLLAKAKDHSYIIYNTYSLCKPKVIYTVAKLRPEAGVFAPCTIAIYHKKGSGKTDIVFPNASNWISTFMIKDKASLKVLKKAQKDIVGLLKDITEE